ncbi:hypothetical protein [Halalkalibacter akibai]|uniref:Amidohydrolase-related domain-containing protein n=1 Tax=Halalkalibacter akibai (strain ATCC 43226 / DSM 21942 / CIP 109018 / JCM 9157 / 1139) TaxID=1236973 RepID=W4QSG8_HALA3|nr:hypothetical protein [Halalkalibacter akibai]GAE34568.1 hypothetical protein JCM9157_1636 [Halalkalibacter akibai JCM 9157]
MYLLDKATKVDEEVNTLRSYLINNGQVHYVTSAFEKWNKRRVVMSGVDMTDGGIVYDDQILHYENFQDFQQRQSFLISRGCTTVAVAPVVEYEKQIEQTFKRAKHAMASSTLDYVIGLTLPVKLLSPSVLRTCQGLRIPFIRVMFSSYQEMNVLPWTHLSQTLLTYPSVLVPCVHLSPPKKEAILIKEWLMRCSAFQIHTVSNLTPLDRWSKALLQKIGLYPQKGILLNGSDADYLLFSREDKHPDEVEKVVGEEKNVYDNREPAIVVIRGEMIKSNDNISLKPGFGRLVEIKRPGKFLSITEASGNDLQQQRTSS